MTLTIILSLIFIFILGFIIGGVSATKEESFPLDKLPYLPERTFMDTYQYADMKSKLSNMEMNYQCLLHETRYLKLNYEGRYCKHEPFLKCFKCEDKEKLEKIKELLK